jgi:hypothetical protein
MNEAQKQTSAVYVGWMTFKNAIEGLAQGVPNVIDRTAFPGQSGGVQSQLLAGLKFLGLTDDDGVPTLDLHRLAVEDEAARKEVLGEILRKRYADLFALDLQKATSGQLSDVMGRSYSVSGDTKNKALRFFLAAAKYAGVPMSRFLNDAKTPRPRTTSAPPRVRNGTKSPAPTSTKADATSGGTSRTITLLSGGCLTISVSVNLFDLSGDDRKFVFGLIDSLAEYQSAAAEQEDSS